MTGPQGTSLPSVPPPHPLSGFVGLDFGLGSQVRAAVEGRWIPGAIKPFSALENW